MRNFLFFVIGAAAGVLVVRSCMLDAVESIGWTAFWEAIGEGLPINWQRILTSATFCKCAIGAAAGGFSGSIVSAIVGGMKRSAAD